MNWQIPAEKNKANLSAPKKYAGGLPAIASTLKFAISQMGHQENNKNTAKYESKKWI